MSRDVRRERQWGVRQGRRNFVQISYYQVSNETPWKEGEKIPEDLFHSFSLSLLHREMFRLLNETKSKKCSGTNPARRIFFAHERLKRFWQSSRYSTGRVRDKITTSRVRGATKAVKEMYIRFIFLLGYASLAKMAWLFDMHETFKGKPLANKNFPAAS